VLDIAPATYVAIRAGFTNITAKWRWLYEWATGEGYTITGDGFEEHLTLPETVAPEDLLFDLWLPVEQVPGENP
jgi:effector-binding domain-containing protein